jgi:hypothetical protein
MSDSIAVAQSTSLPPVGIRGWLLVLCITLVFFGPALTLSNLVTPFRSHVITSDQSVLDVFIFASAPTALSIVLSIAAGISLWTVRPYAIKVTYAFMVYAVVSECVLVPLIFICNLDLEYSDTIDGAGVGRMFVYIAIWGTYLARSKRVHNTFRPPELEAA